MPFTRMQYCSAIAAAVALSLVGCVKRNASNASGMESQAPTADTGRASMSTDTMNATTNAAGAAANYTDAQIAALLDEANAADSSAGAFALTRTTNNDVKGFAKDMMKDHHDLRKKGQDWVQKKGITPAPPSDDLIQQAGKKEMDALQNAPAGAQFDRAYIDQEVAIHQAVIALAKQFRATTQDKDLQDLLDKAMPTLQKHMENAMKLQTKLQGATS